MWRMAWMLPFGFLMVLIGFAGAHAACQWTWDCSAGPGQCRQVPVCDSTLDIPMPRPPAVAPIPMPTVRPVAMPTIPPIGTQSCAPRYLCNNLGQCAWQTICQ
jgi:hypothetical protein